MKQSHFVFCDTTADSLCPPKRWVLAPKKIARKTAFLTVKFQKKQQISIMLAALKGKHIWEREVFVEALKTAAKLFAFLCILIAMVILIILMILGSLWNPLQYLNKMSVAIIDRDNETVGHFFINTLPKTNTFDYYVDNNANASSLVSNNNAWMVFTIPENFTMNLMNALGGNSSVYANNTLYITYDAGRGYLFISFLVPVLQQAVQELSLGFMQEVVKNVSLSKIKDPNVLLNPMPIVQIAVNPVKYFGEDLASGFTFFFMFIISIVLVAVPSMLWYSHLGKMNPIELYFIRQITNLFNGACLSATFTIIMVAFGVNMYLNPIIYFLFVWMVILTYFQIAEFCIFSLRFLSPIVLPLFLILNFSSSSALVMFELQEPFFEVGNGMPMYHAVRTTRHIFFGSVPMKSVGLSIGVVAIYLVVCWLLNLLVFILKVIMMARQKVKEGDTEDGQLHYEASVKGETSPKDTSPKDIELMDVDERDKKGF